MQIGRWQQTCVDYIGWWEYWRFQANHPVTFSGNRAEGNGERRIGPSNSITRCWYCSKLWNKRKGIELSLPENSFIAHLQSIMRKLLLLVLQRLSLTSRISSVVRTVSVRYDFSFRYDHQHSLWPSVFVMTVSVRYDLQCSLSFF